MALDIAFVLNGRPVTTRLSGGELLLELLRERLGLTGTKLSCGTQVCGACTVLVDDVPVSACCYLAADVDGRAVTTVEGARDHPAFDRIEQAFVDHFAVQCGFCTPGLVMTLLHLSDRGGGIRDRDEVAEQLSGNLCRCTGYRSVVDAACDVLDVRR